ncbi:MAG TPA: hypothetical protein DIT64_05630 [Verrucomicrobiales bacterium]|nr:hypothetical protein [Verrucomicrobiales bacterium]
MRVDWQSGGNHVARNPAAPHEGSGLEAWAKARGMSGMCFFQTSGSEGLPKWVALRKEAFLISGQAVNAHFEASSNDRWLLALPLHHVGGFAILARAHLAGCGVARLVGKWSPRAFAEACAKTTLTSLVPAQVHDLVRENLPCPAAMRAVVVGGGGMTPELAAAARALGWPVCQSYGMTEAASQIATQAWTSDGPAGGVDTLAVLPHWQTSTEADGRLRLRGPALAAGYVNRAAGGDWQWQPLDPQNGLLTRDHARLWDADGRRWLSFIGRETGYVKILGELIHLAPLQARLESLAIELSWPMMPILVPRPDARAETELVLVTEHGCPDAGPLLERFHQTCPPWLRVRETRALNAMPRSSLGKVREDELRRLVAEE